MNIRKIMVFVFVCVFALSFAGCKDDTADNTSSEVTYFDGESTTQITKESIDRQVADGILPIEFESVITETVTHTHTHGDVVKTQVQLGMDAETLATAIAESGYNADEHRKVGENYIRHECGSSMTAYFYYTNDDRKNGLAAAVYFGTTYGFEPTVTTIEDVKAVMGTPAAEAPANDKALSMFLFYEPGYTYIDYVSGNNHVSFFFHENGTLGATVVYQDGLWIY